MDVLLMDMEEEIVMLNLAFISLKKAKNSPQPSDDTPSDFPWKSFKILKRLLPAVKSPFNNVVKRARR